MTDPMDLLVTAHTAVDIGVRLLTQARKEFSHGVSVQSKGDRDFVTNVDLDIQRAISEYLEETTPEIGFLGEESVTKSADPLSEDLVWTLDPIDGTSNFAHALPLCSVSLALLERGEPIVGVIAAPFLNLRYNAVKNEGAYSDGHRIRASQTASLRNSIVSIGDYAVGEEATQKNKQRIALTAALAENVERVRMFGAATLDLAWVAEGRTDACVILSNKPWDTAAGVIIAREAGALVTDTSGASHSYSSTTTVAAAPGISPALLDLVRQAIAE
ncbi:MAG: inositol monophosphatase family protein [Segniliparus sp.]|uniref:inositol monophosphatase family protein n=1 Tax=Segniliparus sp. TaxID=2804064 RepID=UPI003F3469EC